MTDKLKIYLNTLHQLIEKEKETNIAISAGSVGWHIEHTYLVAIKVINAVIHSDTSAFNKTFNIKRIIFLTLKKIPRGKAKAPKEVQSKGATTSEIHQIHDKVIEKITLLKNATANQFFTHPFLGNLNKKQTIRFLEIHTKHHLKIINDILL